MGAMAAMYMWMMIWVVQHPLYLSNTVIRYDDDRKLLQVRAQIFEEDLDQILDIGYGANINDTKNPNIQKYINEYVWNNLKIKIDGKERKDYVFIKRSKNYDAIILEYEIRNVPQRPKKISAEVTFLMELFEEQTNIVSFIIGSTKKSFPLKDFNTKAELNL
jgi:hypothetical protein